MVKALWLSFVWSFRRRRHPAPLIPSPQAVLAVHRRWLRSCLSCWIAGRPSPSLHCTGCAARGKIG
jgi:hypothetical protein